MPYRLQDLIDLSLFQSMQDRLNQIYNFPSAIIDNDGHVLTATAWQDLCTKFHRVHPECAQECHASDQYILSHIHEANPAVTYRCPHGLVDNAIPIVIDGMHLGNYFIGQFFLEPPNLEFFRRQAVRFGFDEVAYLEAVERVPIWSQQKLAQYLDFIKEFTEILAGIGYRNLQEIEGRRILAEKERALEETHAFNQQIIDSAQEGIVVYDSELRYRVWNPFMQRLAQKGTDEVLGKHFLEVFPFLEGVGMVERVEMALRGEVAPTIDFPFSLPSGRRGWTSDTCAPLYGKDGAVVGAIATVRDITDRKLAETALAESESRFKRLVHQVPLPIALSDPLGAITYLNDRFSQVFGYTKDDIPTADDWWRRAYPDAAYRDSKRATLKEAVANAAATGSDIAPEEHRVTCKDGTVRLVEVSGIALDGNTLVTFTDLTERKRQEAALLTIQKLESLGTLAGGIAHDFNNILAGILGNLSLLSHRLVPGSEEADLAKEAMEASMTARGLAQQLLTFASGGSPITQVIDFRGVLRHAAAFATRGSTVRCVVELGDHPLPVEADKEQLVQVVQNLVINAVQAMPRGGRILVQAALVSLGEDELPPLRSGRHVRCTVRDEGHGIPEAELPKIFDPYFTTKATGRGLGLAVCHSIIAKHGGKIAVESRPGEGTLFTLHLPALQPSTLPDALCEPPKLEAPSTGGSVLVMDDEPRVVRVLGRMLEHLGYRVESAPDGAAAVAAYRQALERGAPFSAVIMDLTIVGGMGGQEALTHLRALDPQVKAIVSSGYAIDPVMSGWAKHGFLGVLAKPYKMEELSRLLRDVLGDGASP